MDKNLFRDLKRKTRAELRRLTKMNPEGWEYLQEKILFKNKSEPFKDIEPGKGLILVGPLPDFALKSLKVLYSEKEATRKQDCFIKKILEIIIKNEFTEEEVRKVLPSGLWVYDIFDQAVYVRRADTDLIAKTVFTTGLKSN